MYILYINMHYTLIHVLRSLSCRRDDKNRSMSYGNAPKARAAWAIPGGAIPYCGPTKTTIDTTDLYIYMYILVP